MRVLVVKLTSMGDVLHLLPVLSELSAQYPGAVVDWMVEDSFAELPEWHHSVDRVIKVSTRRWRSLKLANVREFFAFVKRLREYQYDYVVDAQGLMKSAVFARFARLAAGGTRIGYSGDSIKESPAAYLYHKKVSVERRQHAIQRLSALFAGGFGYAVDHQGLDYGLVPREQQISNQGVIFLFHGTTWSTKHIPDQVWRDLADCIVEDGYRVKLCWGNESERERAQWIAQDRPRVEILAKSTLDRLRQEIDTASGVIAVDTGLGHMAAALGTPSLSLYGATDAKLTGTAGDTQLHWQSAYACSPCLLKKCNKLDGQTVLPPCYDSLSAPVLWQTLRQQIVEQSKHLGV